MTQKVSLAGPPLQVTRIHDTEGELGGPSLQGDKKPLLKSLLQL